MSPSSRDLLIANALTGGAALVFDWPLAWLLWPYWLQSAIIGWYARQRMLALRDFSTEDFTSNGKRVPETEQGKRMTANFFALHYGGFHLFYLLALFSLAGLDGWFDLLILLGLGLSFVLAQRDTFREQLAADALGRPNLGTLMFLPYLRILPMHATIILSAGAGASAGWPVLLFVGLKTAADLTLDTVDRRLAGKVASKARVAR